MRALLERYIVRSRAHAIVAAALTLIAPFTSFLAAAVVGLVTLRHGVWDGAKVLVAAVAIASAFTLVTLQTVEPIADFGLLMGIPVLALAAILRASSSQGVMLLAAGLMAGAVVVAIHTLAADPVAWWRQVLDHFVTDRLSGPTSSVDAEGLARLGEVLDEAAPYMTSFPIITAILAMLVLLLSRWWHALLDNPGGFGREFRALRLNRRAAPVAAVVLLLMMVAGDLAGGLPGALFQIFVIVYVVQGVAVVHALVTARQASSGWLVAMYATLILMWPVAVLCLALAGYSDTWFDFRRRYGAPA